MIAVDRARKTTHARADIRCFDAEGRLKWEEKGVQNIWHDEGELYLLSLAFATAYSGYGSPTVSNMYLGLDARGSLAEANTLASLSGEPSGDGYSRQALSTGGTGLAGQDFVISQPAAAYQAKSKTVTFQASGGDWSAVTNVFLCTHATATTSGQGQRLLCSLALSTSRTLLDGDSLQVDMTIGISE